MATKKEKPATQAEATETTATTEGATTAVGDGGQPTPTDTEGAVVPPATSDDGATTLNPAESLMTEKEIQLPTTAVKIFLARVKAEWPHSMLQSAGIAFAKGGEAVPIRADIQEFAELSANPYLDLSEA